MGGGWGKKGERERKQVMGKEVGYGDGRIAGGEGGRLCNFIGCP